MLYQLFSSILFSEMELTLLFAAWPSLHMCVHLPTYLTSRVFSKYIFQMLKCGSGPGGCTCTHFRLGLAYCLPVSLFPLQIVFHVKVWAKVQALPLFHRRVYSEYVCLVTCQLQLELLHMACSNFGDRLKLCFIDLDSRINE